MSFFLSKVLWQALKPGNLLLILLCLTTLVIWLRAQSSGRRLLTAVTLAFLVVAVLPIGAWLIAPLENRFPAIAEPMPEFHGIIVLGGATSPALTEKRGQSSVNGNVERILQFVRLARRNPGAELVFTGGAGALSPGGLTEADVARRILDEIGFDSGRIRFEKRSRNTFENATNLKALLQPGPEQRWMLVTSARHMPRAVGVFRAQGWQVLPYPVDYLTMGGFHLEFDLSAGLATLDLGVREWIGLAVYYLMGRIPVLFPAPEDGAG